MQNFPRILLADDNNQNRITVKNYLKDVNCTVFEAINIKRIKEILADHEIILIILGDSLYPAFFKTINCSIKNCFFSVIVVSDDCDESNILKALEAGADDFINILESPAILKARFKSHIRRCQLNKKMTANGQTISPKQCTIVSFSKWYIDHDKYQVLDRNNGNSANLTLQEFNLLNILIEHAGKTVKRVYLSEALKQDNPNVSLRSIDIKITRLRTKLNDSKDNPYIIQTVRGVGYLFNKDCIDNA